MSTKIHFPIIDSTNEYVKNHYQTFLHQKRTLVYADIQTAGKGRFGRKWFSEKGNSLLFTYFFEMEKSWKNRGFIPQVLVISLIKWLKQCNIQGQIKWPNDLYVSDKKVGGILCEILDLGNTMGIVLGAGLNVYIEEGTMQTINPDGGSLFSKPMTHLEYLSYLNAIDREFTSDLDLFIEKGFTPFLSLYNALLLTRKKQVFIQQGSSYIPVWVSGMTEEGEIEVTLPSGEIVSVSPHEISEYLDNVSSP